MNREVYLPSDEFGGAVPQNLDLAADYLELKALFSQDHLSFRRNIVGALELPGHTSFPNSTGNAEARQAVATDAVNRMASRQRALAAAYLFEIDPWGAVVRFTAENPDLGQTAYLVSLLLSNLPAITPLLGDSQLHASAHDERQLRTFFWYFATAAVAVEIGGPAWSFGSRVLTEPASWTSSLQSGPT